MKKAYFTFLEDQRNYPICKALEKIEYKIFNLDICNQNFLSKSNKTNLMLNQKIKSKEEYETLEQNEIVIDKRKSLYFDQKTCINAQDLNLNKDDIVLCFNEFDLFESCCLDNQLLRPKLAFSLVSKHAYYRKLNIDYVKVYSYESLKKSLEKYKRIILKPSICSMGKRSVYTIASLKDQEDLIKKYPNIFNGRLFIAMKYIDHIFEIWAMTLFDKEGNPYILWFSTEKNHATFSVFEEDLYKEIKKINKKLKITNWIAYMQFLVDEECNFHFVDLNPRLPGDDDWYELLYRYMTGKSFAKIVVQLIINKTPPDIIKSYKYVVEEEYDSNKPIKRNQKMWEHTCGYKKKPLLTFKKLDLYQNY